MALTTDDGDDFMMTTHPSLLPTFLPKSYQPTEHEVVIGRGRKILQHEGNVKLRAIVNSRAREYLGSTDKTVKSNIITAIGYEVKSASKFGGFVKKDRSRDRWFVVSESCVRSTIAQAFRDCLSPSYKSSKFSKQLRRSTAKSTPTAVSSSSAVQDASFPKTLPACNGMPPQSFHPITMVTLQRDAARQYQERDFVVSAAPVTSVCSQFPANSGSSPTTTSAILQQCLDILDEDDDDLLMEHPFPTTASSILQRCLDILSEDDDDDDDGQVMDRNVYEPTPIAEQPLSSIPFLADDEHLWGLTI